MNTVKKTTLLSRIRAAIKAFKGKPIGHLYYGLELKKCDECEYRKACGKQHGKWLPASVDPADPYFRCSVCHYGTDTIFDGGSDDPFNYCPNCGAKMDAKEE